MLVCSCVSKAQAASIRKSEFEDEATFGGRPTPRNRLLIASEFEADEVDSYEWDGDGDGASVAAIDDDEEDAGEDEELEPSQVKICLSAPACELTCAVSCALAACRRCDKSLALQNKKKHHLSAVAKNFIITLQFHHPWRLSKVFMIAIRLYS